MIKINFKTQDLNIKYKLFLITSSLLLALAVVIYSILYFLLPSFYENYKYKNLNAIALEIEELSKNSNLDLLKNHLRDFSESENVMIIISDESENFLYGYGRMMRPHTYGVQVRESTIPPESVKKMLKHEKQVSIRVHDKDYTVTIISPLQPVNEATEVIKELMPTILFIVLIFAFIGAYIYSVVVTKPLLRIIEIDKRQEEKRKEFIATISHELKTPITIISGQLEGMIYNVGKYKDRDAYLNKTYEVTQELKELVEEMIKFSKTDMMYDASSKVNVNLSELLNTLIDKQSFLIDSKKMVVSRYISSDINIDANREALIKALNNIINNAIKYSPEKEAIIVSLRKNSVNKLELIVENTGITIPKEGLSKIFNPFYRIEQSRSRSTGGSGLGLYITGRILESHGYKYSVSNGPNSVIFKVTFV